MLALRLESGDWMNNNSYLIGIRIMQKRKENKMTQEQLSELLGMSCGHLSCIERGQYTPTVKCIYKLCDILGGNPNYYLLGEVSSIDENNIITLIKQFPPSFQSAIEKSLEEYLKAFSNELKNLTNK